MPKPYSDDLRERVIEAAEAGASRREAAESFNPCPSSAVKWLQRWHDTGSAKAKPTGGSRSRLEEHAKELLALVAEQPDLTLDEIVAAMRRLRIRGGINAASRPSAACPRSLRILRIPRILPLHTRRRPFAPFFARFAIENAGLEVSAAI
jgi:hypothetical protein